METAAPVAVDWECDIDRLPEEMLTEIISRTSPPDACCAAAVCRGFRAAADSGAVWSCFVPRDFPRFAKGQLRRAPASKKGLFQRLSDQPALLPKKYMRMHLDRMTGAKCFTLSAAALQIPNRNSCHLIPLHTRRKRFSQAVSFWQRVYSLRIGGKMEQRMLSRSTTYGAHMVFKLESYGCSRRDDGAAPELSLEKASVSVVVGGRREATTQTVALSAFMEYPLKDARPSWLADGDQVAAAEQIKKHILVQHWSESKPRAVCVGEEVVFPRERGDGWMEVELGEFRTAGTGEEDGEVSVTLKDTGETFKCGLVVWGIQIRPNKQRTITRVCSFGNHKRVEEFS